MKSSRVFIKANYIKKAKDDWVYCDAHILTHDKLSILKLTSINLEDNVNESDTIKRFNAIASGMKVLLNLSEFKSSEIKPVNFRNTEKFAIKLIPSGILHNKKLFLVPEEEEDLTKWCGALAEYVQKSKETKITHKHEELNNGTMKVKSNKVEIVERKPEEEETPIREPVCIPEEKKDEIYIAMDDNDVYDGNSLENSYTVCVEETPDSKQLGLKGSFILRLKEEGLELVDIKLGEIIHKFPYIFIRRFGAKEDILRLEAGRKCTTGEGYLMFRFKDAQVAVETIRELVREMKKSSSSSQMDCSTMDNNNRNSIALSSVTVSNDQDNRDNDRNSWSNNTFAANSPSNLDPHLRDGTAKSRFFSQESSSTIKSQPPIISPKPQMLPLSPMTYNGARKQMSYPLYSSISSTGSNTGRAVPVMSQLPTSIPRHTATINNNRQPPIINNNFNRANHAAASFSYNRPVQVQIPVTRISQDDSYCQKINGAGDLYDNLPMYEQANNRGRYLAHSANSSVKYSSSYSMQGPLTNRDNGNYDNVPNNQRCIQELETMLNDLGIPSH